MRDAFGTCGMHSVHAGCNRYMRDAFGTCRMHSVHAGRIRCMRNAFGTCGTHSVHAGCIAAASGLPNSAPGTRDARGADAAASGLPRYNIWSCPGNLVQNHAFHGILLNFPLFIIIKWRESNRNHGREFPPSAKASGNHLDSGIEKGSAKV